MLLDRSLFGVPDVEKEQGFCLECRIKMGLLGRVSSMRYVFVRVVKPVNFLPDYFLAGPLVCLEHGNLKPVL